MFPLAPSMRARGTNRKWRQKEQKRWLKHHHSDVASDGEEGVDANGEAAKRGRTETGTGEESVAGGQEKLSVNAVPDVEVRARTRLKPFLFPAPRNSRPR